MRVVIAPDSFKGTLSNFDAASSLAKGWRSIRPMDELILLPMADGGEGSLETIASIHQRGERKRSKVQFYKNIEREAVWLLLEDGTAIIELALCCGLPLMPSLDSLGSHTFALGQVIAEAAKEPDVKRIVICLGGSASTDGGAGALMAMGVKLLDENRLDIPKGGAGLSLLEKINLDGVLPAPVGGVTCLVDVTNPLIGPNGAPHTFARQKGANENEIKILEVALSHLKEISGVDDFEGAGSAGGTPFGLSIAWPIELKAGAQEIATLIGVNDALVGADLVITGEGKFDHQSLQGKVVGTIMEMATAAGVKVSRCVGASELPLTDLDYSLVELAGDEVSAKAGASHWLEVAGADLAQSFI